MGRFEVQRSNLHNRCKFQIGACPEIIDTLDVTDSVAIMTNTTTTVDPAKRIAIIASLLRFPMMVCDVQRFIELRTTPAECDSLIAELVALGFSEPVRLFALGNNGLYYSFKGNPLAHAAHPATEAAA